MKLEDYLRLSLVILGVSLVFYSMLLVYEPVAYLFLGIRIYAWGSPIRLPPFFILRKEAKR